MIKFDELYRILKDSTARKTLFSFLVLMTMFLVNIPIILKEAFSKKTLFDIGPILALFFKMDEPQEIYIPLYQYSLISMFLQYIIIIHSTEIITALIEIAKHICWKLFSIEQKGEKENAE